LIFGGAAAILLWDRNAEGFGVIAADNFGLFVTVVLAIVGVLTIMFSSQVLERDGLPAGEYYALILFSIVGMIMMATATDLLVVFIALEILSLSVYVLTAIRRDHLPGTEAAFKYFLLGAFSSAFFLYGIAFTYGVTGSTRLAAVGSFLSAQSMSNNPMILLALGLLLVGFAFKISAVPFHMWTPDAYEGAPAIVTGFMSTGVKAAAFAAFARVFLSAFEPFKGEWVPVVALIAVATMVLGTVVGVAQSNLKRMLAYSSIAHGGYLLVGLVAANQVGKAAILFYLLAYSVTNLAAFGVIALLGSRDKPNDSLRDYAGLWHTRPARRVFDGRPAHTGRPAADGRLHRQVVHLQCRRQRWLLQSCRHRHAHQRHLRLLLPARRRHDVHGGTRGRGCASPCHRSGHGCTCRLDRRDLLSRRPAHQDPGSRGKLDLDDFLGFGLWTLGSGISESPEPRA
jgi:NADH-quinone oxidoreductase subunit N